MKIFNEEDRRILGLFDLFGIARTENLIYSKSIEDVLRLQADASPDELSDTTFLQKQSEQLNKLSYSEKLQFGKIALVAFHEMFHFHQFILTPSCLQSFIWLNARHSYSSLSTLKFMCDYFNIKNYNINLSDINKNENLFRALNNQIEYVMLTSPFEGE
jgi:hypothetical protein